MLIKMKKSFLKPNLGFSLIEVIIASAIVSSLVLAISFVSTKGITLSNRALKEVQTTNLLSEGAEAVRLIRDNSWTNISSLQVGTNYYLYFNTTTNLWSLSQTPNTIDYFTRIITVSNVYRDVNNDIASTGTLDSNSKLFTITTTFNTKEGTVTKQLQLYIFNIF